MYKLIRLSNVILSILILAFMLTDYNFIKYSLLSDLILIIMSIILVLSYQLIKLDR